MRFLLRLLPMMQEEDKNALVSIEAAATPDVKKRLNNWYIFRYLLSWFAIHIALVLIGVYFLYVRQFGLGAFFVTGAFLAFAWSMLKMPAVHKPVISHDLMAARKRFLRRVSVAVKSLMAQQET